MKSINLIILLCGTLMISCQKREDHLNCSLEKTGDTFAFSLDSQTKNEIVAYTIYEDAAGKAYFVFQNRFTNTFLFYDLETKKLEFKIDLPKEGNNGVGIASGFYIHNLDSIYVPNRDIPEMSLVDIRGHLLDTYSCGKSADGKTLSRFSLGAARYCPAQVIGRTIYVYSEPNRFAEFAPVSITVNMDTKEVRALPFEYPAYPGSDLKVKKYGYENEFSRCYDGKQFVYSFYYDENIYVASLAHDSIRKIPVKSKFLNAVQLPDELTATIEDACSYPGYGNLLYDKYRNVYYRVAYPKCELDKGVRPVDLFRYGRKNFSIIILNEQFEKIGETMFPDYAYNSYIMLIVKEGLYISNSHSMNPDFSDDVLSFERFELVEN